MDSAVALQGSVVQPEHIVVQDVKEVSVDAISRNLGLVSTSSCR